MGKLEYTLALTFLLSVNIYSQTEKEIDSIKSLLIDIRSKDQDYRYKILGAMELNGNKSDIVKRMWDTLSHMDNENLKTVENIISRYGWLGIEKIGFACNQTLFLVIKHSVIAKQIYYLPLLRNSARIGSSSKTSLAYLEDVVCLYYNKYQIYGTQFVNDKNNNRQLLPVYNPKELNARRKIMGLDSIEDYCKKNKISYVK